MRVVIINATVIDGTGAPPRTDSSVVIEGHLIEAVLDRPSPYYDRADEIVDARNGYVIPGLVNHHAHGLTAGPLMILGQPGLSQQRALANRNRLLRQGVTSALNVDGFPTVEDAVAASRLHPLSVKASTLHTPKHLRWVLEGPLSYGGVRPDHQWSTARMFERGALAIGEAGPGIDPHWADYELIPRVAEMLGGRASREAASRLRAVARSGDTERIERELDTVGIRRSLLGRFRELFTAIEDWSATASECLEEAIDVAREIGKPIVMHHTPTIHAMHVDAANQLGPLHIAAHSNFRCSTVESAVADARDLRRFGSLIDIMSGDSFSGREFFKTPAVTFGMLEAGVVDLISTDYSGGFWDSILLLAQNAARAHAIELGEVIRLATSAPADAIPGLAPDRGRLIPGAVADVVVSEPGDLALVRRVFVSGQEVKLMTDDWR